MRRQTTRSAAGRLWPAAAGRACLDGRDCSLACHHDGGIALLLWQSGARSTAVAARARLLLLLRRCAWCSRQAPPVLLPPTTQAYTTARIQNFALHFASRLNAPLTKEQVELVTQEVLGALAAAQEPLQALPQPNLRLVLRHDCL